MGRQDMVLRYLAYAVMATAIVAGLAGVFERDSSATAVASSGEARIDYPRVTRQGLKPTLVVEVANGTARPQEPAVALSSEYLEGVQLAGVVPAPADEAPAGEGLVAMRFAALGPGERLRAVLSFSIDQQAPGLRFRTPVRVALGTRVLLEEEITTLVLP